MQVYHRGHGANGPSSRSRVTDPTGLQLPMSQGYIGTGGVQFTPVSERTFETPGPVLGTIGPRSTWIGEQWAPGQGGDTPGGGGAAMTFGMNQPVMTAWITDGNVTPLALQHRPGTVGFVGSRRSGA